MTERNRANAARRRARGDALGDPPYGTKRQWSAEEGRFINAVVDPDAIGRVVDAYRAAGSANGAAAALNAAGHPSARGGQWYAQSVFTLMRREAPELLPAKANRQRALPARPRELTGILLCHCGATMTPTRDRWTCPRALSDRNHTRPYSVSTQKLLPWIKGEAARLDVPDLTGTDRQDELDALTEVRARTAKLYQKGAISEAELDTELERLDAEIVALRARTEALDVPSAIDWETWPPESISRVLRALWEYVQLGDDLLPREAVWRVPEWRDTLNGRLRPSAWRVGLTEAFYHP